MKTIITGILIVTAGFIFSWGLVELYTPAPTPHEKALTTPMAGAQITAQHDVYISAPTKPDPTSIQSVGTWGPTTIEITNPTPTPTSIVPTWTTASSIKTFAATTHYAITVVTESGPISINYRDGNVTYPSGMSADAASKAFWDALEKNVIGTAKEREDLKTEIRCWRESTERYFALMSKRSTQDIGDIVERVMRGDLQHVRPLFEEEKK